MEKAEQKAAILGYMAQCNGFENHYSQPMMRGLTYSDGVKFVAETAGAYWLISEIYLQQRRAMANPRLAEIQMWFLRLNKTGSGAMLLCYEDYDTDNPKRYKPVISKRIPFTDFPMDEIQFYVENGILFLPAER